MRLTIEKSIMVFTVIILKKHLEKRFHFIDIIIDLELADLLNDLFLFFIKF